MYSHGRPRIGRDSSFVRSMSRSANTLSALKSAPGSFDSAKRIVVLSGVERRVFASRNDDEPREVGGVVLNSRREHVEAEDLAGARRSDGRGVLERAVANQLGAAGRIVRRDDLDVRQRPQELLALRQRLRMRVDAAQRLAARARRASRQWSTSSSTSPTIDRSCSASRSKLRWMLPPIEFSTGRMPCVAAPDSDGGEHVLEAREAMTSADDVELQRRGLAVGAGLALIRDSHVSSSKRRRALTRAG